MEAWEFPTCSKDEPQGLVKFKLGEREVFFNMFLKAPKLFEFVEREESVLVFGRGGADSEKTTLLSWKKLLGVTSGEVGCQ